MKKNLKNYTIDFFPGKTPEEIPWGASGGIHEGNNGGFLSKFPPGISHDFLYKSSNHFFLILQKVSSKFPECLSQ